jgi:hypothetical protein
MPPSIPIGSENRESSPLSSTGQSPIGRRDRVSAMDQRQGMEEHELLDGWKITLVRLVYAICGAMLNERFFAGLLTGTAPLDVFVEVMGKFVSMPRRGDEIMIRLRGLKTGPKISPALDYEVATHGLSVDFHEAMRIVKRRGIGEAHLQGRLLKAWEVFKQHGITSIVVRMLEPTKENQTLLRNSMLILSRYYQAVQRQKVFTVDLDGTYREVQICTDEQNQPDPNLTLFAALNNLSEDKLAMIVNRVVPAVREREKSESSAGEVTPAAEVLYGFDAIRKRMKIPPVKINTLRWVLVRDRDLVLARDRVKAAELIKQVYGSDEDKVKSVIYYVYEYGLNVYSAEQFARGLERISEFLARLETLGSYPEVREEIVTRVREKIVALSRPALTQMEIGARGLRVGRQGREPIDCEVLPEFLSLLTQTKDKSDVYEKLKRFNDPQTTFTMADIRFIALDFHLPLDEADMVFKALRRSFNSEGRFDRAMFTEQASFLALYQRQVFPILLDYLKRTENKKDRLGLLNSLPILFDRVERPRDVIATLLQEFCSVTDKIHHFDRNVMMLTAQLLRHYRKEDGFDIEATPEEVLSVQRGLVEEAVLLGQRAIFELRKELRLKNIIMRKCLAESLEKRKQPDPSGFSPRFVISLLREFYILLALLGGSTAQDILGEAVTNHVDPDSRLYRQPESKKHMAGLLGLLKVIVRAYLRVLSPTEIRVGYARISTETNKDYERLANLRAKLESFARLIEEEGHKRLLRQVTVLLEK